MRAKDPSKYQRIWAPNAWIRTNEEEARCNTRSPVTTGTVCLWPFSVTVPKSNNTDLNQINVFRVILPSLQTFDLIQRYSNLTFYSYYFVDDAQISLLLNLDKFYKESVDYNVCREHCNVHILRIRCK